MGAFPIIRARLLSEHEGLFAQLAIVGFFDRDLIVLAEQPSDEFSTKAEEIQKMNRVVEIILGIRPRS
jgi:hypothetical protein